MPRKCKDCPICGKRALKRLANHLADVHELSSQERQPYLIGAKPTALATVLTELYRLIGNSKKQSKWNKSGIKNIPVCQPKSSMREQNQIQNLQRTWTIQK